MGNACKKHASLTRGVNNAPDLGAVVSDPLHRIIRPAHKSDGPQLFEIRQQAILAAASPLVAGQWADAHPPEWILEVITKRRVWVLEMPAGLVGWVSATENQVDALYTRPDYFRQGIGSALLAFAEDQLRALGFSAASLNASTNAEGFYRARGYSPNGDRHASDSSNHGSMPMRKTLV
jgi:GNAT superfamily N-acetyltransferase